MTTGNTTRPDIQSHRKHARISRALIELAAGTLLLMLPALINGYPFIFPDTGQYLRSVIERSFATDRPPYYSLLVFVLDARLSLWPIAVAQSLAVAAALRFMVFAMIPGASGVWLCGIFAAVAAFTSAGWNAVQIMPDAFTGLLTVLVFAIAWDHKDWSRAGRVFAAVAVSLITVLHYTHLPLVAGLFLAAALIRFAQGAGWSELRRIIAIGVSVSAVAAAAFLASSVAIFHRVALDPDSSIFLAARVLADGPGRDWLAARCPASENPFCEYRDRLTDNSSEFLWSSASPLQDVKNKAGIDGTRRAASQIVIGAITTRPGAQLADALANSVTQLRHFQVETYCPCGENDSANDAIRRYFSREYGAFRQSLQATGRLPVRFIRTVYPAVVYLSAWIAVILLYLSRRHGDRATAGWIVMVAFTLAWNAILCGALSSPENRYGSRVVWLLPLASLLGSLRLWRSRTQAAE